VVGVEHDHVAEDVAPALARQVEVAVLREVHGRRAVRGRVVVEDQLVAVGQRVGNGGLQRPGVALLAVRARVREDEPDRVRVLERRNAPDHLVEAAYAAVQVIGTVIRRQRVGPAVQREPAPGDPVAVTTDDGAEVRRPPLVVRQGVESEDDVVESPVPVRHLERHDDAAVREDARLHPVGVLEGVQAHGLPAIGRSERLWTRRAAGTRGAPRQDHGPPPDRRLHRVRS